MDNTGIVLTEGYAPHQTYRLVTTQGVGRYRVTIVEEPPQQRLLHYTAEFFDDSGDAQAHEAVFNMPLPWMYTYIKAADTPHGWQLWQAALVFSPVKITRPTEQRVFAPYLPNCNEHGEICWGDGFDNSLPDDLEAGVRRVLQNFWLRSFNPEVLPQAHAYTQAVRTAFRITGDHIHLDQLLEAFGNHTVDEILAVKVPATKGFLLANHFWIPGIHTVHDTVQLAAKGYYWEDEDGDDFDTDPYDDDPDDD